MTMNFSCLRCGRQMATMAEVEAHKCATPEMSVGELYARRMGPVSRDELVKACLAVRSRFGGNGNGTELSDAFSALAEKLR